MAALPNRNEPSPEPTKAPSGPAELGAEPGEGHGAERRAAPVEQRRQEREAEIVEGGVGDEEEADEEPDRPADQAEERDDVGSDALGPEEPGERPAHGEQQHPDDSDVDAQ